MPKKRLSAKTLARIQGRTRFIQGFNRLLCIGVAVAFGLLITATALPQKRQLDVLQAKLDLAKQREEEVLVRKEHNQIELTALREDPAFLEIQARDRLNLYKQGERILRFQQNR
jgi:cell division protein FtsB